MKKGKKMTSVVRWVGAIALTVLGATSANAAVETITLMPGLLSDGGSNSGHANFVHDFWPLDLTGFGSPVNIDVTWSSQPNNFSSLNVRLCDTSDCSGAGNPLFGPASGTQSGTLLAFALDPALYYIDFEGNKGSISTWSYSFTAKASYVPLPAAALLFASGLGFLGVAGRKRKGAAKA